MRYKIKNTGIYIHIPYCQSKCLYCDFVSFAGIENTMEDYVFALTKEIGLYGKKHKNLAVDTVYFGGGTPSILPLGAVPKILDALRGNFDINEKPEISIETNPKTLTESKVAEYMEAGISRFSLGLQSSEDKVLKAAGRIHNYRDFLSTVTLLRKHGADNISADIILGLPQQTLAGVKKTAENLVGLHIEHVSAYGLILEPGTPMAKAVKAKKIVLPDEDKSADMYEAVFSIFDKAGLRRYEVSNFAREGFKCRHNLNYWRRGEYIGLGASAHGFIDNRRYQNEKNVGKYISKSEKGLTGKVSEEKIDIEDAEKEYIMLGLRLEEGLDTEKFEELFLVDFLNKYENMLRKLYNNGLVRFEGRFLKVNPEKFNILNKIILEFF